MDSRLENAVWPIPIVLTTCVFFICKRNMIRFSPVLFVLWLFVPLPASAQTGFNGTFLAVVDGMTCQFIIQTVNNEISGTYDEGGLRLQVMGTFYGKQASGDLKDALSGKVVATFRAVLISTTSLELTFLISGQERSQVFLREGRTVSQTRPTADKLTRDPQIIGNWSHQIITGGNGASLQTMLYFQIIADGKYAQYSRSVGGGGEWSYDSGQLELQQQGTWYTNGKIIYMKAEGKADYIAAATYRLYEGKLITQDVNGQKIWGKE